MKPMDITPTNLSINIKFCHYCRHDSDWCETKTKSDYTIWNIYEGALAIKINGKVLSATAGDVLLFKPGESYRAYCTGSCCNFLVTFFSIDTGNYINLLESQNATGIYNNPSTKIISNQLCREYLDCFQTLLSPSLKLYASFLTFFAALAEYFGTQTFFQDEALEAPLLKIHELLAYMDSHFADNISIKDLASFMGMSEKYFIHYFHIHIGKSPKQYLIDSRMKYALELLANPQNTLSEISAILSYSDQYAFSKAFKNYYGEAPGTFRRHYIHFSNKKTI